MSYLEKVYEIAYKIPHLKLRTQLINSAEAVPPLLSEGFSKRRNKTDIQVHWRTGILANWSNWNTGHWLTESLKPDIRKLITENR